MAIGCYTSKGAVFRSLKVALLNGIRMKNEDHNTETRRNTRYAKKLKTAKTKNEVTPQSELGTDNVKVSDNQHRHSTTRSQQQSLIDSQ